MTKTERRKRSRERARQRAAEAAAAPAGGTAETVDAALAAEGFPGGRVERVQGVDTMDMVSRYPVAVTPPVESPFITGPVVPKASPSVRTERLELPRGTPPASPEVDDEFEDTDGVDEDDDDEEGDDDPEGDEDDEDEEPSEQEEDELDAVFNAACGAVEQGSKFTWTELVGCLCEAEVQDPRLGLLAALLIEQDPDGNPAPLTGARVLAVLTDMGLDELVTEARETATLAPAEDGDTPEERAIVRTNARELREQAKTQLASGNRSTQPLKASDIKKRTSLGGVVPVPSGRGTR